MATSLPIHIPYNASFEAAENGSSAWASAIHVGHIDEVLAPVWPAPVLAVACILGMNH